MSYFSVDPLGLGELVMNQFNDTETAPAFILASLLACYPDEQAVENIGLIIEDAELFSRGRPAVQQALGPVLKKVKSTFSDRIALDDLQSEYIDTFDRGRHVTSLYETEYGRARSMVKGTQLVDISGFYRSFGFETGGEGVQAEMIDHVSVELEFYALLCLKYDALSQAKDQEGMEIVMDGRKKFLHSHLGRFVEAICDRPGIQSSPYYLSVFTFCRDLVLDECKRLEVVVEAEAWMEAPVEAEEMNCGGSAGITPC